MSPTLVVYCRYETKSRDSVEKQADTTLKLEAVSLLCWSQADVGRRPQPECRPWPTSASDIGAMSKQYWRPPTSDEVSEQCRPRPTSDADVSVVSALADVGCRRRCCVGAVSASTDVGRRRRSSVGPVSDLGRHRRLTLLLP